MRDGEVLDVFLRRVDELRGTRLIRTGALSDAFHVGATKGQPAVFSVSYPDEDDFRSFLLSFRHLVAKKEPATLDRVANIVIRELGPNRLHDIVVESRETWRRAKRSGAMRLVIDGTDYGPELVLDLYLNGRYFHSDTAKAAQLDSVGGMGARLSRQKLNEMLVSGVNYASELRWAVIVGRAEGLLRC